MDFFTHAHAAEHTKCCLETGWFPKAGDRKLFLCWCVSTLRFSNPTESILKGLDSLDLRSKSLLLAQFLLLFAIMKAEALAKDTIKSAFKLQQF